MITIVLACLGTAIAAWLVPASVDIVSWTRNGPARVAVFAPQYVLWWAIGAALIASLAIAFAGRPDAGARRGRAWIVAPLAALWIWTLPYLPWLADRVPLVLVLAGPLRWAITVPAVAVCLFRVVWNRYRPTVEVAEEPRIARRDHCGGSQRAGNRRLLVHALERRAHLRA